MEAEAVVLEPSLPLGIMPVKPEDKERAKQKAMEAADAAKLAAEAGKEEGKKKMGYLSRGLKAKYMEKTGDTNLPQEEERRRAEYMQPLLDGLKISKNHYIAVVDRAEIALADAKAAAAASTDFALAVCNAEYLKGSVSAPALPSFQEAHHELQKITVAFVSQIESTILEVARAGSRRVDAARKLKENYYEKRMNYDMCLRKLHSCKVALDKAVAKPEPPEKQQKAQDALTAAQEAFKQGELTYRDAERKLAQAIAEVLVTKSSHDVDFLAILVDAQATRAKASQAVLQRLQPQLDAINLPPPLPASSSTAPSPEDDDAAAPAPVEAPEPQPDEMAVSAADTDMMAI